MLRSVVFEDVIIFVKMGDISRDAGNDVGTSDGCKFNDEQLLLLEFKMDACDVRRSKSKLDDELLLDSRSAND